MTEPGPSGGSSSGARAAARLLCLAPNPSVDRLVEVDRLTDGAIHRPTGVHAVAGGKGLNVARAASTLGAEVVAVALLGGHAGRWVLEELEAGHVRTRAAWAPIETRTSTSIADRATRRLTEFYEPGPEVPGAAWDEFVELVSAALADSAWRPGWVSMSGSLPRGAPEDGYAAVARLADAAGGPLLVDTHGPALRAAIAARPSLVKTNAAEAAGLLRIVEPDDPASALAAAVAITRLGAAGAVVTVGQRGAGAVIGGERWRVGPAPVAGRYPVASGDAMTAGLLVGLAEGRPPADALRLGAAAAAANAILPGAGRLDPQTAGELAEKIDLERAGGGPRG